MSVYSVCSCMCVRYAYVTCVLCNTDILIIKLRKGQVRLLWDTCRECFEHMCTCILTQELKLKAYATKVNMLPCLYVHVHLLITASNVAMC